MAVLGLSLVSVTSCVATFREQAVYFREASELPQPLQTTAYWAGKSLAALPTALASSALFTFVYHLLATPLGDFATYFAVFLGVYLCCAAYAYLVAILFPNSNAIVIGASIVFASVVLGGSIITLRDLLTRSFPLSTAPYVSYCRYALEAIFVAEIDKYTPAAAVFGFDLDAYASRAYGFKMGSYGVDVGILYALAAILQLCVLLSLHLKGRDKKR